VSRIKSEAAAAAQREQLEMQRAAQRVALEAEADKQRLRLLWEIDEAKALRDHPELLELRKVSAFSDMAKAGAKFVVGLPSGSLVSSD
jgi:regulator of protease activity HflC (stomatin/prohibitin superfamily)